MALVTESCPSKDDGSGDDDDDSPAASKAVLKQVGDLLKMYKI